MLVQISKKGTIILVLLFVITNSVFSFSHKLVTKSDRKIERLLSLTRDESVHDLQSLVEPLLIERVPGTEGNRIARSYIIQKLQELNWFVEEDKFSSNTPLGKKEFSNIIATKNPNAPRKLILAAHYDSKYFKDFTFIGATDSAVSCGILIKIAQILDPFLENQKRNQDISLQLVFFDGEEAFVQWTKTDSIYGARHLASVWDDKKIVLKKKKSTISSNQNAEDIKEKENHQENEEEEFIEAEKNAIELIDAFILLDLIGFKEPPLILNYFSQTSKLYGRAQRIEKRLKQKNMLNNLEDELYFGTTAVLPRQMEDDHIPFLQRGVPIFHIMPYQFPTVWHTSSDNAQAISYPISDDFVRIFTVFVAEYLDL